MSFADFLSNPQSLTSLGNTLDTGSQLLSAFSHIQYGRQARQVGAYEAAVLRQNAGQALASSQRDALSVDQRTQLVTSRALAVAAASGGGASDPTVVNTIAAIAGEGAYRKAVALYQGEEEAKRLYEQADAAQYRGEATGSAETRTAIGGFMRAGTSLLKGSAKSASLRQKYGGSGPSLAPESNGSTTDDWGIE